MKDTDILRFERKTDFPSERKFEIQWGRLTESEREIFRALDKLVEKLATDPRRS